MEQRAQLLRHAQWLTPNGELYCNLMTPTLLNDAAVSIRAISFEHDAMVVDGGEAALVDGNVVCDDSLTVTGPNHPPCKIVTDKGSLFEVICTGDRFVALDPTTRELRSWSMSGAAVARAETDCRSTCCLKAPPPFSRWAGHFLLCDVEEATLYGPDLVKIWTMHNRHTNFSTGSDLSLGRPGMSGAPKVDLEFNWGGEVLAAYSGLEKISTLDIAGCLASADVSAAGRLICPYLAAAVTPHALVIAREKKGLWGVSNHQLYIAREDPATGWSCKYVLGRDERWGWGRCQMLNCTTVIACFWTRHGSQPAQFIVHLDTGVCEKLTEHPAGVLYWLPSVPQLACKEVAAIVAAIGAVDELASDAASDRTCDPDVIYLVRAVLVGFVLEDARLTQLRSSNLN